MTNEIPNIVRSSRIFTKVEMHHIDLWFSYDTLVAFLHDHPNEGVALVVMQNQWGSTTGRHINMIDGGTAEARARRVGRAEFVKRLEALKL